MKIMLYIQLSNLVITIDYSVISHQVLEEELAQELEEESEEREELVEVSNFSFSFIFPLKL